MRTLSVLTAVHPDKATFLPDAFESLRTQVLPDGWNVEWLITEDGPDNTLTKQVARWSHRLRSTASGRMTVSHTSAGMNVGFRAARNMALYTASGDTMCILDADDLFPSGSVAARLVAVESSPGGWVLGQAQALGLDGDTDYYEQELPPGEYGTAEALPLCVKAQHVPMVPNTLMAPTDLIVRLGGWPAVASVDDEHLLACVIASRPGVVLDADTYVWRDWDSNTSKEDSAYQVLVESDRAAYFRRAEAIAVAALAG